MATEKGRPLPKFGEWDVNNPASAEGFTVIFTKARDEKKSNGAGPVGAGPPPSAAYHPPKPVQNYQDPAMKKWWCCF
ncbi:protein NOI4-like isoform X2 [Punica granatum]|uniref:Protein NOI4-like isoform X2 n=1 Tax=Punica granatum TaxID=22663 RepID=A0A6P8EIW1_PUNGR|nr:protein NOI4-like isoform X2 [Punica granatum]